MRSTRRPQIEPSNTQRILYFCILASIILIAGIACILVVIAFVLSVWATNYLIVERQYTIETLPVCNVSITRKDFFVGELQLTSYTNFELEIYYSMFDGSLLELPNLSGISIRGEWLKDITEPLSSIPLFIPKSVDASSSLHYVWHSNKLHSRLSVTASMIKSIRTRPEAFVLCIFTTDCPSGALFARLGVSGK
jgi:hypothetical protein